MIPKLKICGKFLVIFYLSCQFLEGRCIRSVNTPPTMWFERNWKIPETEVVGSVIERIHAKDNEDDKLLFGLELNTMFGSTKPLPFRIDSNTGVVYLNESLKGRAGDNIMLFVTCSDGEVVAKSEVYVNILDANSNPRKSSKFDRPPPFQPSLSLPPFPKNFQSPYQTNPFYPTQHHDEKQKQKENATTHLRPVSVPVDNDDDDADEESREKMDRKKETLKKSKENEIPLDQAIKSAPDLAITLIPILSVCLIFGIVGIIAFAFRKKICFGKTKGSKDDMRKDSSGSIVLQDDPSFAMQQWRGPRAFGNRYVPWERDANHPQLSAHSSTSLKSADRWEFPRHRLKVFNILGEGAFGQVWKCEAIDIDDQKGVSIVAVKTLKENANDKEREDLLSELKVMKMLDPHQNVVRLLGSCTEKDPIFVIMEFVSKGKLQSYLRNSRAERCYNNMHGQSKTLTSRDLTSFVYQVAKGMEFLSSNGIIHRDLAARNILITEEHVCKVADFGFARDVIDSHIYERKSEGRLPIRWMAPESLYDNIFSVKSDVWSFGVLIWEVVTLGSTPYTGLSAAEVMKKVRSGYRLEKPEHCRRELYNIMYYCWDKDPNQRPSFSECAELLEKLLVSETDYIELERFPDHSYYNVTSLSGEKL